MGEHKRGVSISIKIVVVMVTLVVTLVAINYAVFVPAYYTDAENALMEKAAAFTAVADQAKNHASSLIRDEAFAMDELLAEARAHVADGGDYHDTRFFNVIPVVVGWTTASEAAKVEGIDFKVPAFEARNRENEPEPGSFRAELLRDLEAQVRSGGAASMGRINKDTNTLHYMRAIQLDASCMACHGDPKVYDKDGDGLDPLGFKMEGWKIGDTHGAFEVAMPLAVLDQHAAGFVSKGLMVTVPALAVACGAFIVGLRFLLTRPLARLTGAMQEIASGDADLTKRIAIARSDEIGALSHWFDTFVGNLQVLIRDIAGVTSEVSGAATEFAATNEQMSRGIGRQREQTELAAAAVDQMHASASDVARQSTEATDSATRSREAATVGGGVVGDTSEAISAIAREVTDSARIVTTLGKKSEQIGEIIEVINDIADQTNLLALNAAIEAARAGEHGRGFAVVADEVRKLAERTSKATDEVAGSIREIQAETSEAVARMDASSGQTAAGVDLAARAGDSLREIVENSDQMLTRVQSIAAAAEEQSAAAAQISGTIEEITVVARESSEAANQAADAAAHMSRQAEALEQLVRRFKIDPAP